MKNQFPPHLMFLTPLPDTAHTLKKGRTEYHLNLDYSSLYLGSYSKEWQVLIDMEMAFLGIEASHGITDDLTIEALVPFVSMGDGFLDSPLEGYHRMFGFPNYDKEDRPKDEFGYVIKKENEIFIKGESGGLNIGDARLSLKYSLKKLLPQKKWLDAAIRYEAKLPLGDEKKGFGSGAMDHGFFLYTEIKRPPFTFHITPGYIFVSDPKHSSVSTENITSYLLGMAYQHSPVLSLLLQLNFYTSPIQRTGLDLFDQDSLELALGIHYQIKPGIHLEMALCEDLSRTVPDFNLHSRLSFNFR